MVDAIRFSWQTTLKWNYEYEHATSPFLTLLQSMAQGFCWRCSLRQLPVALIRNIDKLLAT